MKKHLKIEITQDFEVRFGPRPLVKKPLPLQVNRTASELCEILDIYLRCENNSIVNGLKY
jgi:hypothetical protein